MTRNSWRRDEPDSPCLSVCVIHPSAGICIGCHRTAEEVRMWASFDHEERLRLLGELPSRKRLLQKRRGGRRGRLQK
ncbi:MAG: DUF1289 domain-containing protein [Rhodobacteraceae bacterium]|nr:DUF1289 domain-containing protein [Paracoccaceae bacterium]